MKITYYTKSLILSSFVFLSACSPKEESVDIQSLIPQDAEIALYAQSDEKLTKELKAIPEYKETIAELKKYNPILKEKYLELISEAKASDKKILSDFISENDIVGSIESLLTDLDLDIAVYLRNSIAIMTGDVNGIIAIKSGNNSLPAKILNILDTVAKEEANVTKIQLDSYNLFSIKVDSENTLYILCVKDSFILALNEKSINLALSEIKTPTKSVLDTEMFKKTITNPDSNFWIYANDGLAKLVSLMTQQPAIVKSLGIEAKSDSLESVTLKAKMFFNERNDDTVKKILSGYTNFKGENSVKGIYDNSILFASINLPSDTAYIEALTGGVTYPLNYMTFLAPVLKHTTKLEISMDNQDFTSNYAAPRIILNGYGNVGEVKKLIGEFNGNINGVECIETPIMTFAKISDEQMSVFGDVANAEATLNIIKSQAGNDRIAKALSEISMKNCIAELYLDINTTQKIYNKLNPSEEVPLSKEFQEKLDKIYEKNILVAKLGVTEDSISLIAKNDVKLNYKILKEVIFMSIEEFKKLQEELAESIFELGL